MLSVRARFNGPSLGKMLIVCLAVACSNSLDVHAETATAPAAKPGKPSMIQVSEPVKPGSYNAKTLRRLDFTVQGKSCAVCLMGIQRKFKALPGVVKAAVMLKKPYGAVVIYDSSKINMQTLLNKAKQQDKDVKVVQPTDFAIPKIPTILIPLYGIPKSSVGDANSNSSK